jgi:predicted RNase H-like nuclease (RuvC/YqgF family)
MGQQETLSYNSVCMLIGRLVLQHQHEIEQLGQSLAEAQSRVNSLKEEIAQLRRTLTNDTSRQRENNI